MKKQKVFIAVITLTLSASKAVTALCFKDSDPIELHGDISVGNFFRNAQISSVQNAFDGIFDYRLEAHAELMKLREHRISTVTRVEGFGFYDSNIKNFFDDPLIDIPEIYIQDDFKIKDLDTKLVFGKFANRRFFSKNEINSDPFDIGERTFFSALANYSNVVASLQTARDPDQLNSIQATGSYGFYLSVKDNDGEGFKDQWGVKQSFTVAQLDNFANNFYGITEINKNWGDKYPGQFDTGLIYMQEDVLRNLRQDSNSYLFYTSLTQRFTEKLSSYIRYAMHSDTDSKGQDYQANNIVSGIYYKLGAKDSVSSHIVWTESPLTVDSISHLNAWTHKFNDHFYTTLFNTYRYNTPAPTADGGDNNWFIGLNLTAFF